MKQKKIIHPIIRLFICTVLSLFIQISPALSDEKMIVRFNHPTAEIIKEFLSSAYDVAAYKPGVYLDIVITESEMNSLKQRGFDITVTRTESELKKNLLLKKRSSLSGYRDYDQLITELKDIEAEYPDICKLYNIGDTWGKQYLEEGNSNYEQFNNHTIWALKLSDNVAVEEDEPSVYYMGEHHAREPVSLEVVMAVLYHILNLYSKDETVTDRVNDTQIWFVPLLNPNGHQVVTSKTDIWWRKNIRDNNENGNFEDSYLSADGVDLNRNYGFEWGMTGASDDPSDDTYHGIAAWSEPEIQAAKNLLDSHHFVAGITYHSYGELILYPFGYAYNVVAPDNDALSELAVKMAEAIPGIPNKYGKFEHSHKHYDPGASWTLYPTMGDHSDYAYGVLGIFSYTIELARDFIPPAEDLPQICNDNLEAAIMLLNRSYYSVLTGHIRDKAGNPVKAEIVVHGIDDNIAAEFRYPYQSDEKFGRYYRLLTNGTYTLTFQAEGYGSITKKDIKITSDSQTVLDIILENSEKRSGDADLNGTVDIYDALMIAKYDAGLINKSDIQGVDNADADKNGVVNIYDALMVAMYDAGIIASFN